MEASFAVDTADTRVAMNVGSIKVAANGTTIDPTMKIRVRWNGRDASVITPSRIEARTGMIAMEPRPGTNEDSAREPAWPIVTVGRASVRVIVVVAVRAHRSRPHVGRAYSDRNTDSLRMRIRRDHQAETQQR